MDDTQTDPAKTEEPAKVEETKTVEPEQKIAPEGEGEKKTDDQAALEAEAEAAKLKAAAEAEDAIEDGPAANYVQMQDAGACDGSFISGLEFQFEKDGGLPVIETEEEVRNVPVGGKFFAAFIHDPRKSGDHYEVSQMIDALSSGRMQRRGTPNEYWQKHSRGRPPVAERTSKGHTVLC